MGGCLWNDSQVAPNLNVGFGELKIGRHDAHYFMGGVVQSELPSHHRSISTELAEPKAVTDDDLEFFAVLAFRQQRSADRGGNPQ